MQQTFIAALFRFTRKPLVSGITLAGLLACSGGGPQFTDKLKTHQDSLSYALGRQSGEGYRVQNANLNEGAFFQGFMDAYLERAELIDPAMRRALVIAHEEAVIAGEKKRLEKEAMLYLKAGLEYMLQNGKSDSVITTASGLQYKVLTKGTGPHPSDGGIVEARYVGRLIDGEIFDSTTRFPGPIRLMLKRTIFGMSEVLLLMRAGSKWEVTIPHELAYGNQSPKPSIKPYSVLIFDLEVVKIIR